MMDDTTWTRPANGDATFDTDKLNLHVLNGQCDEDGDYIHSS